MILRPVKGRSNLRNRTQHENNSMIEHGHIKRETHCPAWPSPTWAENFSSTFFFAARRIRKRSKRMPPTLHQHRQRLIPLVSAWSQVLMAERPVMLLGKLQLSMKLKSKQQRVWKKLGHSEQNRAWKREWQMKECMLYSRGQMHDSRIV